MMAPAHAWVYRARLVREVDGDTVVVARDCGEGIYHHTTLRFLDVDAREIHGVERPIGLIDAAWVQAWLAARMAPGDDWPLTIETVKDKTEKYGRLLAQIWAGGEHLNRALIDHIAADTSAPPPS